MVKRVQIFCCCELKAKQKLSDDLCRRLGEGKTKKLKQKKSGKSGWMSEKLLPSQHNKTFFL